MQPHVFKRTVILSVDRGMPDVPFTLVKTRKNPRCVVFPDFRHERQTSVLPEDHQTIQEIETKTIQRLNVRERYIHDEIKTNHA